MATSSKNDSDFNVSESSYEQMAKEDDPVTDSDDDHHNDKAITGCLKGIHDFAKGFHSTGIDEERSKGKCCAYFLGLWSLLNLLKMADFVTKSVCYKANEPRNNRRVSRHLKEKSHKME